MINKQCSRTTVETYTKHASLNSSDKHYQNRSPVAQAFHRADLHAAVGPVQAQAQLHAAVLSPAAHSKHLFVPAAVPAISDVKNNQNNITITRQLFNRPLPSNPEEPVTESRRKEYVSAMQSASLR